MHDSLEVMLTEYKIIRKHITESIDHQLKLFSIIVTALGVIYGIIFAYNEARDLILLIPLIILPLGLRFQFEDYAVDEYGKYLIKLEEKIQKKDTLLVDGWEGWQHHWIDKKDEVLILLYSVGSKWLLFILIPMGVAVLYSVVVLFLNIDISNIPSNLSFLHWLSLITYSIIISTTFVYFIIFKKIYKEKIIKQIIDKIFTRNKGEKMKLKDFLKNKTLLGITLFGVIMILLGIFIIICENTTFCTVTSMNPEKTLLAFQALTLITSGATLMMFSIFIRDKYLNKR